MHRITIDVTPPTVDISAPSSSITATGPVTYTVTYTGASDITLASEDITLNPTGGVTADVEVEGSGSGQRSIELNNISGNGSLGISIGAGTATDAAGNLAPAAGPSPTFQVDNTALAINIGAPSQSLTRSGPVVFSVTYENATSVSLEADDIELNFTGDATGTIAVTNAKVESSFERLVTISDISGDGTLGISIDAATALDDLSNPAPAAGPSATFEVDNTAPDVTVNALSTEDTTPALSGSIDDGSATISVTVSGQTLAATNNGATWSVADNALAALLPGVYDIEATATDAAGNVGSDATTGELTIEDPVTGTEGEIVADLPAEFWMEGIPLKLTAPDGFNYEWRKDGVPLIEDAPRLTGVNKQQLVFNTLLLSDAGVYTVRYDNGVAKALVESESFVLSVEPNLEGEELPVTGLLGLMVLIFLLSITAAGLTLYRSQARPRI